ncbi:hypothetical protein BDV98DRAFT_561499 [Pterulicium gracile]|uniref:Uncharacterized protein n=1 Tax=Pterulicium gracile TaxID=1884261 RepID=A0A5C3QSZ5_9AGAR|nr:hypothetical protein BDV98DRAFT_561499 [Pterula gracilis]
MDLTVSGIEKLCNELLCHIFRLAIESDITGSDNPATPCHLAAVCRRWREISLRTANLWTCFVIGSGKDHRCKLREDVCTTNQVAILRCCLKLPRSKNLPIHIDITHSSNWCIKYMLRALARDTHRCGSLRFHPRAERFSISDFGQQLYPGSHFAALRRLDYHCDFDNDRLYLLGPQFDSSSLQSLTSLRLVDWIGKMGTDTSFPWAQLKQISLAEFKGCQDDLLRLFQACPSITHFALSSDRTFLSDFHWDEFTLDSIVLPTLIHLEIELGWDGEDGNTPQHGPLLDILGCIRIPKLTRPSFRQLHPLLFP